MIAASLGTAVAKVGAFMAGAEFGTATSMPWGVNFIGQIGARHPVQLYEAVFAFLVYIVLRYLDRQKKRSGGIFFLFLLLMGLGRWVFEFFRADSSFLGPVKIAQLFSVTLVVIGIIGLYYFSRRDWRKDFKIIIERFEKIHLPKPTLKVKR